LLAALASFLLQYNNSTEPKQYRTCIDTRRHPPEPTQSTHTSQTDITTLTATMSATAAVVPSTCCGREGTLPPHPQPLLSPFGPPQDHTSLTKSLKTGGCICAKEAKCSCGKQAAMHCNCEKAQTENQLDGARCSCSMSLLPPHHPPTYLGIWTLLAGNKGMLMWCEWE